MRILLSNRFTILFGSLIAFILIVPPVVECSGTMDIVPWALSVIVVAIILATRSVRGHVKHRVIVVSASAALVGLWSYHSFMGGRFLERIDAAMFAFLLFAACFFVLRQLSNRRHVDRETIAASLAAYLLFGLAMSRVYSLLYLIDPGAFYIPLPNPDYPVQPSFLYFSFVVLSTVGFGDITPASAIARSLMIVEAIFGVFYLTVVISRLVSLYRREETDGPKLK
jgi:voltage-gated potassium channel